MECKAGVYSFRFVGQAGAPGSYMEIRGGEGWSMRVPAGVYSYGYLRAAAEQGLTEQLSGFASMVFGVSMLLCGDALFAANISGALAEWYGRRTADAVEAAAAVSEEMEAGDDALMHEIAEEGSREEGEE